MDPDTRSTRSRIPARLAALRAAVGARLRAQRGSMLIEAMVGAVVLAIATTAVLNGLDGAQSTGARNKARSVQASLAQQDIERLRAKPITALSNYRETRTVNVAGVTYTIVSRSDWVRDATGVVGCTSDEQAARYVKLTSTVTSPTTVDTPVKEASLLTPSAGSLSTTGGTATVRLTGRDGLPKVGLNVAMSGPGSYTERTDENGCAIFGYLPAGSYVAQVSGLVTPASTLSAREDVVVYAGKSTLANMQVEVPAALRAVFVRPNDTTSLLSPTLAPPTAWGSITVKNSSLPGVRKVFTGSVASTLDATELFPFSDGVGVYAGNCTANDPTSYVPNYFATSGRGSTALNPGDTAASRPVNVEMATMRVTVTRQATGSPAAVPSWIRTQVRVWSPECGNLVVLETQPPDRTASTTPVSFDLAVPFGTYRVCGYTRGRTSATNSTLINRRYTTTASAGSNPSNPKDPALVPPLPVQNSTTRNVVITTPSASTTLSNGTCF
jgi:Tfp pilus assembly protein PilV